MDLYISGTSLEHGTFTDNGCNGGIGLAPLILLVKGFVLIIVLYARTIVGCRKLLRPSVVGMKSNRPGL